MLQGTFSEALLKSLFITRRRRFLQDRIRRGSTQRRSLCLEEYLRYLDLVARFGSRERICHARARISCRAYCV